MCDLKNKFCDFCHTEGYDPDVGAKLMESRMMEVDGRKIEVYICRKCWKKMFNKEKVKGAIGV